MSLYAVPSTTASPHALLNRLNLTVPAAGTWSILSLNSGDSYCLGNNRRSIGSSIRSTPSCSNCNLIMFMLLKFCQRACGRVVTNLRSVSRFVQRLCSNNPFAWNLSNRYFLWLRIRPFRNKNLYGLLAIAKYSSMRPPALTFSSKSNILGKKYS